MHMQRCVFLNSGRVWESFSELECSEEKIGVELGRMMWRSIDRKVEILIKTPKFAFFSSKNAEFQCKLRFFFLAFSAVQRIRGYL